MEQQGVEGPDQCSLSHLFDNCLTLYKLGTRSSQKSLLDFIRALHAKYQYLIWCFVFICV